MEVIKNAESVVEWFLWTIEHTNSSLDIQCNISPITGFVRHTRQTLYAWRSPWWAKRCIEYQVNCWCARSSKGTILLHTHYTARTPMHTCTNAHMHTCSWPHYTPALHQLAVCLVVHCAVQRVKIVLPKEVHFERSQPHILTHTHLAVQQQFNAVHTEGSHVHGRQQLHCTATILDRLALLIWPELDNWSLWDEWSKLLSYTADRAQMAMLTQQLKFGMHIHTYVCM